MANTEIDNYKDSIVEGSEIEFEWNEYIFIKYDWIYMICENLETIITDDFHDDLEFWENHIFGKWCKEEKQDDLQNNFRKDD